MKLGSIDTWQLIFFTLAAFFVAYQTVRGWRRGLARQFFNLLGLTGAYIVSICGGDTVMPLLRPLGFPDVITSLASGSILGLLVFAGISSLGIFLFKRTSQQTSGGKRIACGVSGAGIGMVFGLFTVWLVTLAVRLLGTVAESEMLAQQSTASAAIVVPARAPATHQTGGMISGLAHMKHSIEMGKTGSMVLQIDPLPIKTYSIMNKIIRMISNPANVDRFLAYPGAKSLTEHPRIIALRQDPDIAAALEKGNLLALLRNEHLVQAANDPELTRLLTRFDLEKALDYSLTR